MHCDTPGQAPGFAFLAPADRPVAPPTRCERYRLPARREDGTRLYHKEISMAHNDPFTLDLFGNTSLASGLGLGVSAFPTPIEVDDNDHARSSPTPGRRSVVSSPSMPAPTQGKNFHLIGNRGLAKSWRDRARDNLAAIRLAAAIEAEGRQATSDEQAHLIRFTGFGASELANGVFRRRGRTRSGKAGRRSPENSRALWTPGPTPRSPAAPSTPTSRRNTLSARSGRL